jgi:hypothetical protein
VLDTRSGRVLGSLLWPAGNQIFAVEPVPARFTAGLPLAARERAASGRVRALFAGFVTHDGKDTR